MELASVQSSRRASASTWKTRRRVQTQRARDLLDAAAGGAQREDLRAARRGLGQFDSLAAEHLASFSAAPVPTARASASLAHGLCGTYRRVPPKLAISLAAALHQ